MTVGSSTLSFAYDANGKPMTVTLNGTVYYYTTNPQGDVTGILDASGSQIVTYTYDAWGNVTITSEHTLATLNPLTYRGYVYDHETELYYLQSRYYNPQIGRFLNADGLVATGQGLLGNNMFAYCGNNPVRRTDSEGTWWIEDAWEWTTNTARKVQKTLNNVDWYYIWEETAFDATAGAAGGAVTGALSGYWGAPFTEGLSILACGVIGGLLGGVGGAVTGFVRSFLEEVSKQEGK